MDTSFVDAHVHFWSPATNPWYPELSGFAEYLQLPELLNHHAFTEYARAASPYVPEALVHVNATTAPRGYLKEAEWLASLRPQIPVPFAMIGSIDLSLDDRDVIEDLEAQKRFREFRGIRLFPSIDPNETNTTIWLDWLERNNAVFDLVLSSSSADAWFRIVRDRPNLHFAIEHCGSPEGVDEDSFDRWRSYISRFGALDNVVCKATGIGMVTRDLSAESIVHWVEVLAEVFGWQRMMFGSNMPIELMGGNFRDLVEGWESVLVSIGPDERSAFMSENARAFYRV